MNQNSFEEAFSDILKSTFKTRIYFGKIVNKINGDRLDYNIYNPIILKRLPSLYKFRIYNNDFLYTQIPKDRSVNDKMSVYLDSRFICKEVYYVYIPSKSHDIMIYQYGEGERETILYNEIHRTVSRFEIGDLEIECVKIKKDDNEDINISTSGKYMISVDVDGKDSERVLKVIFNMFDDVHYKLNKSG